MTTTATQALNGPPLTTEELSTLLLHVTRLDPALGLALVEATKSFGDRRAATAYERGYDSGWNQAVRRR